MAKRLGADIAMVSWTAQAGPSHAQLRAIIGRIRSGSLLCTCAVQNSVVHRPSNQTGPLPLLLTSQCIRHLPSILPYKQIILYPPLNFPTIPCPKCALGSAQPRVDLYGNMWRQIVKLCMNCLESHIEESFVACSMS